MKSLLNELRLHRPRDRLSIALYCAWAARNRIEMPKRDLLKRNSNQRVLRNHLFPFQPLKRKIMNYIANRKQVTARTDVGNN